MDIPEGQWFWYTIKKPAKGRGTGKRATFSLQTQYVDEDGRKFTKAVSNPDVDQINKRFLAGILDRDTALAHLKDLTKRLYVDRDKKLGKAFLFNDANRKLLQAYWDAEYSYRILSSPDSMWFDLASAVDSVGKLALLTGSREELQAAVNKKWSHKPNKQRRVVDRLNQLLKHSGRSFTLKRMPKPPQDVVYLTENELNLVLPKLKEPFRTLCALSFYTGGRLGELLAIEDASLIQEDEIWIEQQLMVKKSKPKGPHEYGPTKNRKIRRVLLIPGGAEVLARWLKLPKKERMSMIGNKHAEWIKSAVIQEKRITRLAPSKRREFTFHCLRHSYAVWWAGKGATINDIANALGDGVKVCEEYYTGFMLSDAAIDRMRGISS